MLTHLGIAHSLLHFEHGMALRDGDVSVLAVPASHVTGLIAIILTMLRVGGSHRADAGVQGARLPRARRARAHDATR